MTADGEEDGQLYISDPAYQDSVEVTVKRIGIALVKF